MRIRQTEKTGERGCLRDVCHRSKLTRQEKEGGEVYEEKTKIVGLFLMITLLFCDTRLW